MAETFLYASGHAVQKLYETKIASGFSKRLFMALAYHLRLFCNRLWILQTRHGVLKRFGRIPFLNLEVLCAIYGILADSPKSNSKNITQKAHSCYWKQTLL